jgi:hypothetical protein
LGTIKTGAGNDLISGFGPGKFYGGDGEDMLMLPSGSYTVCSEFTSGVNFTTFLDTTSNKMFATQFEVLQVGDTLYNNFSSLPAIVTG